VLFQKQNKTKHQKKKNMLLRFLQLIQPFNCFNFISQIGFHYPGEHSLFNGVADDDVRTKESGCANAHHIPVKDRYARAAAVMVCAVYVDAERREYSELHELFLFIYLFIYLSIGFVGEIISYF
jgi:hypothetical protein